MTNFRAIRDYHEPAGGWGALKAVAVALTEQDAVINGSASLMRMNQPQGFDCPGCAWPDPKHTSSFEFCENGANNLPDCSNMCHEATSVGLPKSLGVGKGTVLLEDFDVADAIFIFGQNPGTNSPRMMTSLRNASRRGARIISFNPLRERALERFQAPQSPIEMITLSATQISSKLFQVRVGGDVAALKGIMKVLVEADEAARAAEQPAILDWDFIRGHTVGIEALA